MIIATIAGWGLAMAALGVAITLGGAIATCWRSAVKYGRRQEKRAIEQAVLKQLVDANLLAVVNALSEKLTKVQGGLREVKQAVAAMRRASKPNGLSSDEIGDQVGLLRQEVGEVARKLDAHLGHARDDEDGAWGSS